jgi:hypothetical protein
MVPAMPAESRWGYDSRSDRAAAQTVRFYHLHFNLSTVPQMRIEPIEGLPIKE